MSAAASSTPTVHVTPSQRTVNPSVFDPGTQYVVRCVGTDGTPYAHNLGIFAIVVSTTGTMPELGDKFTIRHRTGHTSLGLYERVAMPDIRRIRFWVEGQAAERKPRATQPAPATPAAPQVTPLLLVAGQSNYNGRTVQVS